MSGTMPLKILIVEDVPADQEILEHEIRKAGIGFDSRGVDNEEDFILAMDEFDPDIILSDYSLPTFDGMTALRLSLKRNPLVPFIIVTGSMNEETAVECMRSGAADYLIKDHLLRIGPAITSALKERSVKEEKERALRDLTRSEIKYRELVENANSIILKVDRAGNITYFNEFAQHFFGYSEEEIIGKNVMGTIVPKTDENGKDLSAMVMDILEMPESYASNENENMTRDGSRIWIAWTNKPIVVRGGDIAGLLCIGNDITARKNAEKELRRSLVEKEVLLKEVHHRVKNNMQIISSLLSLQSKRIHNPEILSLFMETRNRILSMAYIHEKLYQSEDFSRVDFSEYVPHLAHWLFTAYGVDPDKVELVMKIKDICLHVDYAIPCGLMLNELISNSIRHAFPDGRRGTISVQFTKDITGDARHRAMYCIDIQDDGIGMPESVDIHEPCSLGLELVNQLVRQIDATLVFENGLRTRFEISFSTEGDGISCEEFAGG